MKRLGVTAVMMMAAVVGMGLAWVRELPAQVPGASGKPTVYVSDFELDVVAGKPGANAAPPPATAPSNTPGAPNAPKEEDPVKIGRRLVDLLSSNLVDALQKAGYSAQRLGRNQARPSSGVQIRGLFAEVDAENHWRRAVIRTAEDTGKLHVLVSVANLARPEQALYEIAPLPGNESKPGAVITLSSYVPLAKFEMDKDASEDSIKRTTARIVAEMEKLLNANPTALPK